jgi:hypothetical protein
MAEQCAFYNGSVGSIYKSAGRSERNSSLYSIFKDEEEAQAYLKTGRQWINAVKHIPTGNVWESAKQAQDFLHCSYDTLNLWIRNGNDFVKSREKPVIKDDTLKYVRKNGYALFSYKGHTLEDDKREKNILDEFKSMEHEYTYSVNKIGFLKKQSELSPSHKEGELIVILSVTNNSEHNYKVRFQNGEIGYLKEEEFGILE